MTEIDRVPGVSSIASSLNDAAEATFLERPVCSCGWHMRLLWVEPAGRDLQTQVDLHTQVFECSGCYDTQQVTVRSRRTLHIAAAA